MDIALVENVVPGLHVGDTVQHDLFQHAEINVGKLVDVQAALGVPVLAETVELQPDWKPGGG